MVNAGYANLERRFQGATRDPGAQNVPDGDRWGPKSMIWGRSCKDVRLSITGTHPARIPRNTGKSVFLAVVFATCAFSFVFIFQRLPHSNDDGLATAQGASVSRVEATIRRSTGSGENGTIEGGLAQRTDNIQTSPGSISCRPATFLPLGS